MIWVPCHHPDISLPMIGRKLSEEFIDLLLEIAQGNFLQSWARNWNDTYPSLTAYKKSMYRLRKDDLIAYQPDNAGDPVLILTE